MVRLNCKHYSAMRQLAGRYMRICLTKSWAACLFIAVSGAAQAQVTAFNSEDYGKTVLPIRQSIGSAVSYIKNRGNSFEPVGQLLPDNDVRRMARAVGRLDILVEKDGQSSLVTCTGTIVRHDLVLTNHHCIPGLSGKVVKASVLLDYVSSDGKGAKRVDLATEALESDSELDYGLVRITGQLPEGIVPLKVTARRIRPRESLMVVHHPAGQVKMMSRFRCFSARSTPQNSPYIRHVCDTLPGSSGAILFDSKLKAVAIHHSGGLNENDPDSFNRGTLIESLTAQGGLLKTAVASTDGDNAPAASPSGEPVSQTADRSNTQSPGSAHRLTDATNEKRSRSDGSNASADAINKVIGD